MNNEKNLDETWGYDYKCGGIPKYPAEYHFKIDNSIERSEEERKARRKKLSEFMAKYGLEFVDEES